MNPRVFAADEGRLNPQASADDVLRVDPRLSPADEPRSGPRILPLAIALIFGLLLGFAAGYGVGIRDGDLGAPESTTSQTPPLTPPAPDAGGKEWSEQAIAPPGAVPPQTAEPPGAPPDVQPDTAPGTAATSAAARATSGRMVVRSTPSGAAVTVNGRWRGRTPLTLDTLPFAKYVVRIVQPGFVVAREEVALSSAAPERVLSVRLEGQARTTRSGEPQTTATTGAGAFTGTLFVDSRPRGARVFLNGRAIGTTPLSMPEVPIGAVVVRLELPNHRPWSSSTRIVAGETIRVTGSLERNR